MFYGKVKNEGELTYIFILLDSAAKEATQSTTCPTSTTERYAPFIGPLFKPRMAIFLG